MKNLIIIDDHALLRQGISSWISNNSDWNVVIAAENFEDLKAKLAESGLQSTSAQRGDCLISIVDLSYKTDSSAKEEKNGWEIIKWLREQKIDSVVFSSHDSGYCIEKAMSPEIGAKGFVSKCSSETILLDAINTVALGKTYIQPDLFSNMIQSRSILQALSPKEQKIADFVLEGFDNVEIAKALNLNVRTVENYICKLYDKCGTSTRNGLIALLSK